MHEHCTVLKKCDIHKNLKFEHLDKIAFLNVWCSKSILEVCVNLRSNDFFALYLTNSKCKRKISKEISTNVQKYNSIKIHRNAKNEIQHMGLIPQDGDFCQNVAFFLKKVEPLCDQT